MVPKKMKNGNPPSVIAVQDDRRVFHNQCLKHVSPGIVKYMYL